MEALQSKFLSKALPLSGHEAPDMNTMPSDLLLAKPPLPKLNVCVVVKDQLQVPTALVEKWSQVQSVSQEFQKWYDAFIEEFGTPIVPAESTVLALSTTDIVPSNILCVSTCMHDPPAKHTPASNLTSAQHQSWHAHACPIVMQHVQCRSAVLI